MARINVHVALEGESLPEDAKRVFVVAKNGNFLYRRDNWVKALVPRKEIPLLQHLKPTAELLLPRMDSVTFQRILAFFRRVYHEHGTEAYVELLFNPELGWNFGIPHQRVSVANVHHSDPLQTQPYNRVGTAHSHGSMSAFHSGTDIDDEKNFDGIHITFGNIDSENFSLSPEVVVDEHRFPLQGEWVQGIQAVAGFGGGHANYTGSRNEYYKIIPEQKIEFIVPDEWMTKIHSVGRWTRRTKEDIHWAAENNAKTPKEDVRAITSSVAKQINDHETSPSPQSKIKPKEYLEKLQRQRAEPEIVIERPELIITEPPEKPEKQNEVSPRIIFSSPEADLYISKEYTGEKDPFQPPSNRYRLTSNIKDIGLRFWTWIRDLYSVSLPPVVEEPQKTEKEAPREYQNHGKE